MFRIWHMCTIFWCQLHRFLDNEKILKWFQVIVAIILFFPSAFLHTQRRRKIKGTWMKDFQYLLSKMIQVVFCMCNHEIRLFQCNACHVIYCRGTHSVTCRFPVISILDLGSTTPVNNYSHNTYKQLLVKLKQE